MYPDFSYAEGVGRQRFSRRIHDIIAERDLHLASGGPGQTDKKEGDKISLASGCEKRDERTLARGEEFLERKRGERKEKVK